MCVCALSHILGNIDSDLSTLWHQFLLWLGIYLAWSQWWWNRGCLLPQPSGFSQPGIVASSTMFQHLRACVTTSGSRSASQWFLSKQGKSPMPHHLVVFVGVHSERTRAKVVRLLSYLSKTQGHPSIHFSRTSRNVSTEGHPKPTRIGTLPATKVTRTRKQLKLRLPFPGLWLSTWLRKRQTDDFVSLPSHTTTQFSFEPGHMAVPSGGWTRIRCVHS